MTVRWGKDDQLVLLERIENTLFEDSVNYKMTVRCLDWDSISFPGYSPADCKQKFTALLKQIRCFRTLSELIQDVETSFGTSVVSASQWRKPVKTKRQNVRQLMSLFKSRHTDLDLPDYYIECLIQKALTRISHCSQELPQCVSPDTRDEPKAETLQLPSRPLSCEEIFRKHYLSKFMNKNGENFFEVQQMVHAKWKSLHANAIRNWKRKAKQDKIRFQRELSKFEYKPPPRTKFALEDP